MHTRLAVLATLVVLSASTLAAQPPRPTLQKGNTVLLAGYRCQADQLARADALIDEITAPVLNKHVSAGRLISWGYMGVYIGDQVNRQIYVWATDPVALMQARQVYLPEIQANAKFAELTRLCGSATISLHNLLTVSAPAAK
jgi:hypothetical protein